jgi:hypothetical protein
LRATDTRAEYLVARFKLRYVLANRFDLAGHINAESRNLWLALTGQ